MKFLKIILVSVSLALTVGACTTTNPFATVTNPVTNLDIWRVKNTYAATLQLAASWRSFCYARPYATLMTDPVAKPVCQNRRNTVRQIQKYQPLAGTAVRKADEFVKQPDGQRSRSDRSGVGRGHRVPEGGAARQLSFHFDTREIEICLK